VQFRFLPGSRSSLDAAAERRERGQHPRVPGKHACRAMQICYIVLFTSQLLAGALFFRRRRGIWGRGGSGSTGSPRSAGPLNLGRGHQRFESGTRVEREDPGDGGSSARVGVERLGTLQAFRSGAKNGLAG
jgi:hypothetical protein